MPLGRLLGHLLAAVNWKSDNGVGLNAINVILNDAYRSPKGLTHRMYTSSVNWRSCCRLSGPAI